MPAPLDSAERGVAQRTAARAVVLCAGNELARDDGVGIRVGRILERLELPSWVRLRFYQELGWGLLDIMASTSRVIVVDATWSGRAAGTCTVSRLEALAVEERLPLGCHGFGLGLLAELARELCPRDSGRRVTLVGVEAARLDGVSTELSPGVREALPEAVGLVLSEIDASSELLARGRELAREAAAWEPALLEAHAG